MPSAPDRERHDCGDDQESSRFEALWRRWVLPASIALLVVVFAVAVIAQRVPQWFPVLDLAMTELRVRDVFTRRSPLIGLPGRIGEFPDQGSHPGPLSFYALAPFYRLFGSSAWALLAATAALNVIACSVALWIARRRGGAVMVAAVLLMLTALLRGYGMESLIEPWNPLMPLLWWVVLLLAAWSLLCGDVATLPIAVVAASFCAQTHVPYLLLALGVGLVGSVGVMMAFREADTGSPQRRTVLRWVAVAVVVAAVLWTPPIVDQLRPDGGNISMLVEHFAADPPEERIGPVNGAEWLLVNLNPWYLVARGEGLVGGPLVTGALDPTRSALPGALLVIAWLAALTVAVRWRHRVLLSLDAVIGVALVLGVFSLSSVFGKQWYYLTLWSWPLAVLMIGSIAWTGLRFLRRWLRPETATRMPTRLGLVMSALAVVLAGVVTIQSLDDDLPDPMLSAVLAELVPTTADALEDGVGGATGSDGRYLVTWSDAYFIGSQGYALASELERRGFDVGALEAYRVPITPHRVLAREDATAEVHLATGYLVDDIAGQPGAIEVARVDPRSGDEVAEFDRLRDEIIAELRALGLVDLVPLVDENLFAVTIDPRLPVALERKAFRLLELGQPTAIFILPVQP